MAKRNVKASRSKSSGDVPSELDFRKLRFVGFGLDALDRYEADNARTIVLDKDVAEVFRGGKAVNSVLRAFISAASPSGRNRRRKSA